MATTRRTRSDTAAQPKRASTTRRRRTDFVNLMLIGAMVLIIGIISLLGVHIGGSNTMHPIIWWLPWLPIVVGLGLLGWALSRVGSGGRKSEPGEALEPR